MDNSFNSQQKNSNGGLYAVVAILVVLVLVLGGFIVYKEFIQKDDNNSNTNVDTQTNTQTKETSKIEYSVSNGKLYVNGKESEIINAMEYTVKGQIEDVLIVSASYLDGDTTYALNKTGKIVFTFSGKGNVIREDAIIEGNSVIITSDNLGQDPQYVSCNANATDVVLYKEKFTYSNGRFSSSVLLSSETAKDYITKNNISCD